MIQKNVVLSYLKKKALVSNSVGDDMGPEQARAYQEYLDNGKKLPRYPWIITPAPILPIDVEHIPQEVEEEHPFFTLHPIFQRLVIEKIKEEGLDSIYQVEPLISQLSEWVKKSPEEVKEAIDKLQGTDSAKPLTLEEKLKWS